MKKLQWKLQEVEGFDKPKIVLEQYATSAELATQMLSYIHSEYDDIESKAVADFGCGTGMLSIAAALLGAGSVVGFDIDSDALEIAQRNCEEQEITIDFIQTDLETLTPPEGRQLFDVIITNPPFGTKKNAGIDVRFVQTALKFAPVVYSLHKTTTRKVFFAYLIV